ncbi:hypothetical protein [Chryseobacterium taklimakanense]|uniref:hypothetical protein n=1 Tax=Chryseobacterium taklimakanense TaxID=536441 RepID=UPI001E4E42B5|nr:hypothetical protein [Chryseobacterium taklimakanense]
MQKVERINKEELVNVIKSKIKDKIKGLEKLIAETRASNNETKSSMGDKYETGREMLQQEINNLQVQLNEVIKQQSILQKLQIKNSQKVESGALVQTEKGLFFISVSAGELVTENQKLCQFRLILRWRKRCPEKEKAKILF